MSFNGPSRLRHNITALGLVQIANYAIPLITLPYLTRILGTEAYGQVAFAQAVMAYFLLVTDYGFSWSATRKIAARRDDRVFVSRVFLGTWAAQWLLLVLSAGVAAIAIFASDRMRGESALYAAAFSAVLGNVLFPVWFLQGLERMREVAAIQVATRLLALLPLFTLVRVPEDAVVVLVIQGGAGVLGGLLSLCWIRQRRLIDWRWPSWRVLVQELREGGPLFGSRIAISLYTILVPLALGWMAGPVAVGYFALADKVRTAAQSCLTPLSQALFPRMSHLYANDPEAAFVLLKRSAFVVVLVSGAVSILLWWLADALVLLLAGPGFAPAAEVLRWVAFLPLVIGLSNLLGVQVMLPKQLNRPFNVILTSVGVVGLLIVWPLVDALQATGAAQTMLVTELLVTCSMGAFLWCRGHLSAARKMNL